VQPAPWAGGYLAEQHRVGLPVPRDVDQVDLGGERQQVNAGLPPP
jgi:hypothetical protein